MTIAVTVKTSKENGATVEAINSVTGSSVTKTEVPKDSERLFHVWGDGTLIIRESK